MDSLTEFALFQAKYYLTEKNVEARKAQDEGLVDWYQRGQLFIAARMMEIDEQNRRRYNALKEYGLMSHLEMTKRVQAQLNGIADQAQRLKEESHLDSVSRDHAVNILAGVLVIEEELKEIQ
jgi:phage terminase large subunit-like protein